MVIDASIAAAWCFPDERTPAVLAIRERAMNQPVFVPTHYHLELANVLLTAERRRRITTEQRNTMLELLSAITPQVDPHTPERAFNDTVRLAATHRLTVYDAAYLELASRKRLPLATLDSALAIAARSLGIDTLGT